VATVGAYLSERQWGTVREDYSAGGDAWSYAIAGISDNSTPTHSYMRTLYKYRSASIRTPTWSQPTGPGAAACSSTSERLDTGVFRRQPLPSTAEP
jgi:hypothetical protein